MSVLVFIDGDDDLSLGAVTLGRRLGTAKIVRFDGPYAPAAWARDLAARDWKTLVGSGSDRGNEVLAHVAAQLDLPFAANVTDIRGDQITRQRWGGSLLEEARVHADRKLYTAAPFTFVAPRGSVGDRGRDAGAR